MSVYIWLILILFILAAIAGGIWGVILCQKGKEYDHLNEGEKDKIVFDICLPQIQESAESRHL